MHEANTMLDSQIWDVGLVHILRPVTMWVAQMHMCEHLTGTIGIPLIVIGLMYLHIMKISA